VQAGESSGASCLCGEQARLSLDEQESLMREQATLIWAPGIKVIQVWYVALWGHRSQQNDASR
jgi:hypothetical protein